MCKQKICAIIVAGGKGRRMGGKIPKQFIKIDTIPIIIKTLLPFEDVSSVGACPQQTETENG
ncbi:2-C-methyl-D-erythritol 4-phosphate cytidylyltransferase [candidate division WOR-3 bacterium]|nr:2-C-methyl-D-erythritol 4-phosphate cytidylyltransferase [candidate division WOR-3 bacterium]MCK4577094.1 2-C-methyl-D-erythritol 4-phosphate cytidylyltransferase [candidate division WOR-3 bacterium]